MSIRRRRKIIKRKRSKDFEIEEEEFIDDSIRKMKKVKVEGERESKIFNVLHMLMDMNALEGRELKSNLRVHMLTHT